MGREFVAVADLIESEGMHMCDVLPKSKERRSTLSAYETIQVLLGFGMLTMALITLIVKLLKHDKK